MLLKTSPLYVFLFRKTLNPFKMLTTLSFFIKDGLCYKPATVKHPSLRSEHALTR